MVYTTNASFGFCPLAILHAHIHTLLMVTSSALAWSVHRLEPDREGSGQISSSSAYLIHEGGAKPAHYLRLYFERETLIANGTYFFHNLSGTQC